MSHCLYWAVFLALLSGPAVAQTPLPALEKLTPAQKAKLAPRRPTRQIVGSPLPARPASAAPDPIGTLPVHPAPSNAAPLAPMPVPVSQCGAGGCSGADGVRYNAGAAGVLVDPAGRTCHKTGTTIACF